MNIAEFNAQMKRLSDTFGAQHYKQERLNMIFSTVRDFSSDWLRRTVDGLITTARYAPLPGEFSEAATLERERAWQDEKIRRRQDATEFWSGQSYDTDDRKMIFETIIRRMKFNRNMRALEMDASTEESKAEIAKTIADDDSAWLKFMDMLKSRGGRITA